MPNQLDQIFQNFIRTFGENQSNSKCTTCIDSTVDGKRRIIYGFDAECGQTDGSEIIAMMSRWKDSLGDVDSFETFVITFKYGEEECFHFSWDHASKRFLTEDPNGSVFAYNFDTNTLDRVDDEEDSCHGQDVCETEQNDVNDCCDKSEVDDNDEVEMPRDSSLASVIKSRIEAYENEKGGPSDPCADCKSFFCPVKATDLFIDNVAKNTNYATILDENKNVIGMTIDVIELIPADVELPADMSNIDVYKKIYTEESDQLDWFCQDFVDYYGFTKCHWDAVKNEDGTIGCITVTWIF